ncbi:MAG: glutaredoxin 3 [Methylovirgula sp.]
MSAPEILIYTTRACPYCRMAKELLRQRNLAYEEISVEEDFEARAEMTQKARGRGTVPQIFFGDRHIGGCEELYELHTSGKLDTLIASGGD